MIRRKSQSNSAASSRSRAETSEANEAALTGESRRSIRKKHKHFAAQHDDEEVLLVFRRHPVAMRKGLIAVLIGLLFGMIPSAIWPTNLQFLWGIPIGFGLGMIVFARYWVDWYFSVFVLSDQRLIVISQAGLFNRSVVDVGLDKIQNINYNVKGMQETLLGFGTIVVQTFVGDIVLDRIPHPHRLQVQMIKIIKELGYSGSDSAAVAEAMYGDQ